ncbi:MAG: FAD:protein FMN transferase [Steroidobacteraceae bacterium]
MASPCEVLVETDDADRAADLAEIALRETRRIEQKFSRYRSDSETSRINQSGGATVTVDAETALLLDFAQECFRLSGGRFDITSGVLRRCWRFDGSDRLPTPAKVQATRRHVGFHRLTWKAPNMTLPQGMEIDFGGIGKEYAVDRVLSLLARSHSGAVLVNLGGDLAANRTPAAGPWRVAVERPDFEGEARLLLSLEHGGLATSGDTRRFLQRNGVRYGHILDPHTGWPVKGAPRSITVAAGNCLEAGMLATFAMLHGADAERFLTQQGVKFWALH